MKKRILLLITAILVCALLMTACGKKQSAEITHSKSNSSAYKGSADKDESDSPYAVENRYDIPEERFEKRDGTDYGKLLKDVSYDSTVAGDKKQINILLPAGYDEKKTYPVTYVFHGFGGDHNTHLDTDSYLVLLYGNMLSDGIAVPQIIVGMDMYTDKLADKDGKSDEELRYIYDKAIEETAIDLMPFIEKNYPVKKGRENAAVVGMSEGGAKSLCTGFQWLDKFGYIGLFSAAVGNYTNDRAMSEMTRDFDKKLEKLFSLKPFYYIAIGDEDFLYQANKAYRENLDAHGYQYVYKESDCGHVWKNWRHYLTDFSQLLFK